MTCLCRCSFSGHRPRAAAQSSRPSLVCCSMACPASNDCDGQAPLRRTRRGERSRCTSLAASRRSRLDRNSSGSLRLFRASAIDIARRHASVSDADFLVALRELGDETVDRLSRRDMSIEPLPVLFEGMALLGSVAWLSLGLAFAFRGGLTFQLFRVVARRYEGSPALTGAGTSPSGVCVVAGDCVPARAAIGQAGADDSSGGGLDRAWNDCRHDDRRRVLGDCPSRAWPAGSHRPDVGRAEMTLNLQKVSASRRLPSSRWP